MGLTLAYVTWVPNPKDLSLNWYWLSQNWWNSDHLELPDKWFSFEPFLMFSCICKDSRENTVIRESKLSKFSRWNGKNWLDLFFTTSSLPHYPSSELQMEIISREFLHCFEEQYCNNKKMESIIKWTAVMFKSED